MEPQRKKLESCMARDKKSEKIDSKKQKPIRKYLFNPYFETPPKLHALCDDTKVHMKIYFNP